MHVSGGISLEIVNIGGFLIHLGQEKVSFFDSFRLQLLKFFILLFPGLQYMAGTCAGQDG
jgi:hypothetical protein